MVSVDGQNQWLKRSKMHKVWDVGYCSAIIQIDAVPSAEVSVRFRSPQEEEEREVESPR